MPPQIAADTLDPCGPVVVPAIVFRDIRAGGTSNPRASATAAAATTDRHCNPAVIQRMTVTDTTARHRHVLSPHFVISGHRHPAVLRHLSYHESAGSGLASPEATPPLPPLTTSSTPPCQTARRCLRRDHGQGHGCPQGHRGVEERRAPPHCPRGHRHPHRDPVGHMPTTPFAKTPLPVCAVTTRHLAGPAWRLMFSRARCLARVGMYPRAPAPLTVRSRGSPQPRQVFTFSRSENWVNVLRLSPPGPTQVSRFSGCFQVFRFSRFHA